MSASEIQIPVIDIPVRIMGVTIGSASGWDELEGKVCVQYYNFKPKLEAFEKLRDLTVSVDFADGEIAGYRGVEPNPSVVMERERLLQVLLFPETVLESKGKIPLTDEQLKRMIARIVRQNPELTMEALCKKIEKDEAWVLSHMDAETFRIIRGRW